MSTRVTSVEYGRSRPRDARASDVRARARRARRSSASPRSLKDSTKRPWRASWRRCTARRFPAVTTAPPNSNVGSRRAVAADAASSDVRVGVVVLWRNFGERGRHRRRARRSNIRRDGRTRARRARAASRDRRRDGDAGVGLAGWCARSRRGVAERSACSRWSGWKALVSLMQVRHARAWIVPNEVLDRGVRASLHQLLSGFMHVDPHPGICSPLKTAD